MADILIIDDDPLIARLLARMVERHGHQAAQALTLGEGYQLVQEKSFDVVFLDVRLPDGNGLDRLADIRASAARPEVIIMTGLGDPDGAELAIKNGAWDYIEKPASLDKMTLPMVRALEYRKEREARGAPMLLKREDIIGDSPPMRACLDIMAQAAGADANVLITGETGTGKELFAWGIHRNSQRAGKSFVVVDCTALPDNLVESLLFGHVKGSFTGADRSQRGLIEQAHGGTLFLDEVGELPPTLQKSFLRVIQERRFRPVGSDTEVSSDFRLIAATNRDLEQMVAQQGFRQDLFFRLRSFHIDLPPLRGRLEDMADLVNHHLARLCQRYKIRPKGFSPDFLEALQAFTWPGNVREMVNVLERTVASALNEPILFPYHLPTYLRVEVAKASLRREAAPAASEASPEALVPVAAKVLGPLQQFRDEILAAAEKRYLQDLMALTQGDIQDACRISRLSRGRLYALLKKYEIIRAKAE
ncbi:MAG: sigma-54-dependent Fis family transcriptional regulator [Desulfarculus sp.]|nr:sigma-54-dependent Fis family transcriptional regulator [Desulfarculus sp.]